MYFDLIYKNVKLELDVSLCENKWCFSLRFYKNKLKVVL